MPDQQQKKPPEETGAPKAQTPAPRTQQPAGDAIDLLELMYRLLGSWKLILLLAVVLAIGAGVYTDRRITPMYRATSTIYVVGREDSLINLSELQLGTVLTKDYIKIFQMWEIHEEVISNLNLPYSYSYMRSMLSVVNDEGTRMLDITFTSPDPNEAATVANEYAKVVSQYIADTMVRSKPSIMSVALPPANPIGPNRTQNITKGFMAGALIACAIVILRALLDDKYKTAEEIRRYTGLATLAVVPVENEKSGRGKKNKKKKSGGKRE